MKCHQDAHDNEKWAEVVSQLLLQSANDLNLR